MAHPPEFAGVSLPEPSYLISFIIRVISGDESLLSYLKGDQSDAEG